MFVMQADVTFLSIELHYVMAVMLMNVYATHLSAKQIQFVFSDGPSQASVTVGYINLLIMLLLGCALLLCPSVSVWN